MLRSLIIAQHSPGATIPHGMIKAGMDTDSPGNVSTAEPSRMKLQ